MEDKKQAFLDIYTKIRNINDSCKAVTIGTHRFYDWLDDDEGFKQAWQDLKKDIDADRLAKYEAELDKRALFGSKQSDILLMFGLKSLNPQRYRENAPETRLIGDITVKLGVPSYSPVPIEMKDIKQLKEGDNAIQITGSTEGSKQEVNGEEEEGINNRD